MYTFEWACAYNFLYSISPATPVHLEMPNQGGEPYGIETVA
jgi:hypothetical protein